MTNNVRKVLAGVIVVIAIAWMAQNIRLDFMQVSAAGNAGWPHVADFLVDTANGKSEGQIVIRITDKDQIAEARKRVAENDPNKSDLFVGLIVKSKAGYNSNFSYHVHPDSVRFTEFAIEVCDATAIYVEDNLDIIGDSTLPDNIWCPWSAQLLAELPIKSRTYDNAAVYYPTDQTIYFDKNGNGAWDGPQADRSLKLSSSETMINFRVPADYYQVFVGDWDGNGTDEPGVYIFSRQPGSNGRFALDLNGNGNFSRAEGDVVSGPFGAYGSIPVVGDFNGNGIDEVAVWWTVDQKFYIDSNENYLWGPGDLASKRFGYKSTDLPVVGDYNSDGRDEIAIYHNNTLGGEFVFDLDFNGNFKLDSPQSFDPQNENSSYDKDRDIRTNAFGHAESLPLMGDWNGDGKDEIAVYDRSQNVGRFWFDIASNLGWDPYDRSFEFGYSISTPLKLDSRSIPLSH